MPAPIFYGVNRLEASAVTSATTVTNFPITRLSDRFADREWQGTGPIVWDQGVGFLTFDAVLGTGHNLSGATLTVQTDNNPTFTSPTTLGSITAPAGAFRIPCTGAVERYSRLSVTSGPGTLHLAELWASVGTEAPRTPLLPTSPNQVGNFVGQETDAGLWLAYVRSDPRWDVEWDIIGFTRTVRDTFLDFFRAISGGAKPFFVVDDESVVRFVRWLNPATAFAGLMPEKYQARFQLRAVA